MRQVYAAMMFRRFIVSHICGIYMDIDKTYITTAPKTAYISYCHMWLTKWNMHICIISSWKLEASVHKMCCFPYNPCHHKSSAWKIQFTSNYITKLIHILSLTLSYTIPAKSMIRIVYLTILNHQYTKPTSVYTKY